MQKDCAKQSIIKGKKWERQTGNKAENCKTLHVKIENVLEFKSGIGNVKQSGEKKDFFFFQLNVTKNIKKNPTKLFRSENAILKIA